MPSSRNTNSRTPSTTWTWRYGKIATPPEGTQHSRPKGVRWFGLPRRNPRETLRVTMSYRGGPEAWVEVHARGTHGFFPGDRAVVDVLWEITQANSPR
jgi:hypothetical protein